MGILSSILDNGKKSNEHRLAALQKKVRMLYNGIENSDFLTYVELMSSTEGSTVIRPFAFCLDVVEMMMGNTVNFNVQNYYQTVKKAEQLYQEIFIYDEDTPDLRDVQLVFLEFFEEDGVVAKNMFRQKLFLTFRDKNNYIYFMNTFMQHENARMIMPMLETHGLKARQYFIDDMEYTFHMIELAKRLVEALAPEREVIVETEMKKLERMNGIYQIDAVDIARAESQLNEVKNLLQQGSEVISLADQKTRQLRMLEETMVKALQDTTAKESDIMKAKAAAIRDDMQTTYEGFVREQKDRLVFEREEFVKNMFAEAAVELEKLRATANALTASTTKELVRANQEAEDVMKKVDRLVREDSEIRKLIRQSADNQAFMNRINKMEMLNDANMELIEEMMQQKMAQMTPVVVAEKEEAAKGGKSKVVTQTVVVNQANVKGTGETVEVVDDAVIPDVVETLDETIEFAKRMKEIRAKKKVREQMGEHFHEKFDDVLVAIMENTNPYLIGPSGCGKTYMINQIASLLGVECVDIGYINEEYDILGFQTANGGYSTPNFYRCYKYGKIAFCDELDNGNSKATVKLNSFLSNNEDASYNFPNGENVHRHPNFRIIAAGNTDGAGADVNYNTREKIEESVQQRFTPIYVGYDNAVEKNILKNFPNWFEFCALFREATDAYEVDSGMSAPGILTTRDTVKIRKYLEHESFSMDKIIQYEFVQTKDLDYLLFLDKYITDNAKNYPNALNMIKSFSKQVQALRRSGGKRV